MVVQEIHSDDNPVKHRNYGHASSPLVAVRFIRITIEDPKQLVFSGSGSVKGGQGGGVVDQLTNFDHLGTLRLDQRSRDREEGTLVPSETCF